MGVATVVVMVMATAATPTMVATVPLTAVMVLLTAVMVLLTAVMVLLTALRLPRRLRQLLLPASKQPLLA